MLDEMYLNGEIIIHKNMLNVIYIIISHPRYLYDPSFTHHPLSCEKKYKCLATWEKLFIIL